ncbi:MAG TPA: RNA polymerase factor sigma-54 [Spirochaetia bacterium]|nr:RNA polymerase factor sigma-54 [Spirochaetia bacterium]
MQSQRPVLKQVQKLKMTPQLYQAVRLMALPLQELRTSIEEELEKNPALQVMEDHSTVSLDALPAREKSEGEGDFFDHSSDTGYSRADAEAASDARRQFIEGALSLPESLQEHLLWQLALQPIPVLWQTVGELLIRNLDDNGFHREPPEILLKEEKEKEVLSKVMDLIQGFEPLGVCVKDVRESLLIQIRRHPSPHPRAEELVEKWFPELEKQKLRDIEKGMRLSESRLKEIIAFVRTLDPLPGRSYSRDVVRYVLPDVQVTLHDGEFVIILNDEVIPVLGINPLFEEMAGAKEKPKDPKTRQFVSQNLQDARWFIRTIGQRNETLLKVCRAIVEFQREFFLKGPKYLKPLTLKDIAGEIGVHEATVSRITSAKYVQTEWGIFALKHFFSNSVAGTGSSGSRFSKEGVKEIIREIIGKEGGGALSDQRIVEMLAIQGVSIARRTVAKYRGELAIDSSYQRRRT